MSIIFCPGPVFGVKKSADQAITSSTTLTDDTELTMNLGVANYEFQFYIPITIAGAASGVQFQIVTPSSPSAYSADFSLQTVNAGGTITGISGISGSAENGSPALYSLTLSAATRILRLKGYIENTTEGALKFQFAQKVSDAAAVTVLRGANMTITALP